MKHAAVAFVGSLLLFSACNSSSFSGATSPSNGSSPDGSNYDAADTHGDGSQDLLDSGSPIVQDQVRLSKGIDLVVALDSSGSMAEERAAIEANLNKLLAVLLGSELDPRIHLMLGSEGGAKPVFNFPANIDSSRIAIVNQRIGSNNALSHVSKLLSGLYAARYLDVRGAVLPNPPALRPDVQLEVLVISDDDGLNPLLQTSPMNSNLARDFDPTNQWKATVSGIVGLENSMQAEGVCELARVGYEYINLAARTGGSLLDICSQDWSSLLLRFSDALVKRSGSVLLSKRPLNPNKILVKLDGELLPPGSWTWHALENRVYLGKAVNFSSGMVLEASYNASSTP